MSHLSKLNAYALEGYLNGEYGPVLQREAQQVLYERGRTHATMTDEEMVDHLVKQGYLIFTSEDVKVSNQSNSCPWCGSNMED